LATSPTSGGRSVGIVRLRPKATEFFYSLKLLKCYSVDTSCSLKHIYLRVDLLMLHFVLHFFFAVLVFSKYNSKQLPKLIKLTVTTKYYTTQHVIYALEEMPSPRQRNSAQQDPASADKYISVNS
jgi:hypothetical protein